MGFGRAAALAGLLALALAGAGAAGGGEAAPPAASGGIGQAEEGFKWPLLEPVVLARPFDLPAEPWLAGHRGVDLAAAADAVVLAPAAGVISFNGWIADRHVLVIRHGDLASTLEPTLSDLPVGARVAQGEPVGRLAGGEAAHCPSCLHWGVRRGGQYLDPALLVAPRPRAVLRR
ncbi:MAG: peptidoglycan DD-metalloendopeptidase family protein [Bifidobacteriaceae bacterium]|jgi:murein DD-endopeptidase MepM/ murein hydrolase activator NlpD|nr:peptidoglycan DD-metalloendopeptidase family protein [Bifidobacteriaceae bacterium]